MVSNPSFVNADAQRRERGISPVESETELLKKEVERLNGIIKRQDEMLGHREGD